MKIEFEARYYDIDVVSVTNKLNKLARQLYKKSMAYRLIYDLNKKTRHFMRIRQLNGFTELSIKRINDSAGINGVQEESISFMGPKLKKLESFFKAMDMFPTAYQETERVEWKWADHNATITLDYWPGLKPIIEIEAETELRIELIAQQLDLGDRFEGDIADIYKMEYGISREELNSIPKLTREVCKGWRKRS